MRSDELKQIVKEKYGKIAGQNSGEKTCGCGTSCCGTETDYTIFSESYTGQAGYNPEADLGLGCGIPTDFAGIKNGDHVLDLGSGAGNDCFVARALVGETGKVTGIDFTLPMIEKARENCRKLGYDNVEFVLGDIEDMPLGDDKFDVLISNCVLNLVPDKKKAFREIFRVLKPGGRLCVSDVVIVGELSDRMKRDAELYAGCVAGAGNLNDYLEIIRKTGFRDMKIHRQKEIKMPSEIEISEVSAGVNTGHPGLKPGIYSITISAVK